MKHNLSSSNFIDYNNIGRKKVTKAIEEGVNVLIWSFISYDVSVNNKLSSNKKEQKYLRMKAGQNINNYKLYREQLIKMGHASVKHLVSFGGWNGPHLPAGYSGSELYSVFREFNEQEENIDNDILVNEFSVKRLWDGIDWDLEGHDDVQHSNNQFSLELLNQIGEFSYLAKQDGLITSIAPPESYLDTTTSRFSRFVNLTYPNDAWHQDFEYHGWNVYAYVMAKYGQYIDFAFIQFYESYSHALYQTEKMGMQQSDFFIEYIQSLSSTAFGYNVDFEDDEENDLKNQFVALPLSKIVFGFANGWAFDSEKAIFVHPSEIKIAYDHLKRINLEPRGLGFWVVDNEGTNGVELTKDLNAIIYGNEHTVMQS